jgi:hypothetical protein
VSIPGRLLESPEDATNVRRQVAFQQLVVAPSNVRARLYELLSVPPSDQPDLAHLLEHPSHLRFRAASIEDGRKRTALARTIRARASHELKAASLR